MHYDMKHMGAIIQEARIAHGMTQSALAEKIDISLRTVIAIETGKRNPTFEVLYKIIRELNIPADLIFRPDDVPGTPEQEQFIQESSGMLMTTSNGSLWPLPVASGANFAATKAESGCFGTSCLEVHKAAALISKPPLAIGYALAHIFILPLNNGFLIAVDPVSSAQLLVLAYNLVCFLL